METAVYKAPQINGSWIKFPCLVDSCSVDLIMEFHTEDDVPYKLYHEGDFHWCTYTPEITYQILSGNAHWDDKFKKCEGIIKQLIGSGVASNRTVFRLDRKAFKDESDLKDLLLKGALIEHALNKKTLSSKSKTAKQQYTSFFNKLVKNWESRFNPPIDWPLPDLS